jgi:hypothetical protein
MPSEENQQGNNDFQVFAGCAAVYRTSASLVARLVAEKFSAVYA